MDQRTIVITGASDGIGAVAARAAADRGDRVFVVGRSPEKTQAVAASVGAQAFSADFANLNSVRQLAQDVLAATDHIHVLSNNAGGLLGDREVTIDGFEKTFQVNHLAPFLLTRLLNDAVHAAHGHVVNTSSVAARLFGHIDVDDLENERQYKAMKACGDAKLTNILFTRALHARGTSAVAFHPGNVATNFASENNGLFRLPYRTPLKKIALISAEEGGSHLDWFIDHGPGDGWKSGEYYELRHEPKKVNPQMYDDALVDAPWTRSLSMTA